MCKVHGTGYQAAVANVEAATHQKYIEFDLRYTLPLLRALSMGLHDDSIELYHLTSSPSRVQRKTENHRYVGAQGPSCLNVDLGKCQDIYTQYTVLNLTKIYTTAACTMWKLKQLYKHLVTMVRSHIYCQLLYSCAPRWWLK